MVLSLLGETNLMHDCMSKSLENYKTFHKLKIEVHSGDIKYVKLTVAHSYKINRQISFSRYHPVP